MQPTSIPNPFRLKPTSKWLFIPRYMFRLVCFLSTLYYRVKFRGRRVLTTPIDDAILLRSAAQLARDIRSRTLTSRRVLDAYIARIRAIDGAIGAVVEDRFEAARAEAEAADAEIEAATDPQLLEALARDRPLLGVPYTTKESIPVAGMRSSVGLQCRREFVASHTADVCRRMRSAGAILLAHTNVPETCFFWDTQNPVYGRTRNPYDLARSVGGSTGGEGALLAAAGSPLGIGSDIGGSIRIPACLNGVFGFKPSADLVTVNDMYLSVSPGRLRFLSAGPMSRHAEDLLLVFPLLVHTAPTQSLCAPVTRLCDVTFYYAGWDSAVQQHPLVSAVSRDVRQAFGRLLDDLRGHAATLRPAHFVQLFNQVELYVCAMKSDTAASDLYTVVCREECDAVVGGATYTPRTFAREAMMCAVGRSKYMSQTLLAAFLERNFHEPVAEGCEYLEGLRRDLHQLLAPSSQPDGGVKPPYSVLIYPSLPYVAPYIGQARFMPLDVSNCFIFNALGLPVVNVPLGVASCGLPVGVQIVGALGCDMLCLQVAKLLEDVCDIVGWVSPCPVNC